MRFFSFKPKNVLMSNSNKSNNYQNRRIQNIGRLEKHFESFKLKPLNLVRETAFYLEQQELDLPNHHKLHFPVFTIRKIYKFIGLSSREGLIATIN